MSITVNSKIIAEARIQGVSLRQVVGAYELQFVLDVATHPQDEYARRVSIIGASVALRTSQGGVQPVGFARPESAFDIRQGPYPIRMTPMLVLPIQPGQLAAIERSRETGEVTFELLVTGVGTDLNGDQQTQDQWRFEVQRSEWLQKLRSAGARNILLLEVPLPLVDESKEWAAITNDLQRAEVDFREGDYNGCVSRCRIVLDEMGHQKFATKDWYTPLLERLAAKRADMTAAEREGALWATARHYAHLAHHSISDGGVSNYSRSEAQLVLTMVASLIAHARAA